MFMSFLKKAEPSDADRRQAVRHETEIEATLSCLGQDYDCVIVDVSARGMTVSMTGAGLCTGLQVMVRPRTGAALCGTVQRHRDGVVGVQFIRPLAVEQVRSMRLQVSDGMKARAGRTRLHLPAMARFGNESRGVEVMNLSVGGLLMASRVMLRAGQSVMIEFADLLPVGGHVRWSRAGRCGVMFSKLLSIGVAEELARRMSLPVDWLDEVKTAHELAHAA